MTQASLAALLGVAVGTVNWHIKRLIGKGYIKVKRAQRRKLRYIITPDGLAFRARLTVNYIETSMNSLSPYPPARRESWFRSKEADYHRVQITGEGDIADICRLTCLEQAIDVVTTPDGANPSLPVIEVSGMKVHLRMPEKV